MARARPFHRLVQLHVAKDRVFAEAPLREGIDAILSGDGETGKAILRNCIKARRRARH
jgi:hypothetical protein